MDITNIFSLGAIVIQAMLVVVFVILDKIDKRKDSNKLSEPDNPLLLTIKAMEVELAELHENNIHMKRIAQLEKDIKEANKHAEALSKLSGNYGSTTEEVGEPMAKVVFSERVNGGAITVSPKPTLVGGVGNGDRAYRYYSDGSVKADNELQSLIAKLDKSIHRTEYGQWNTIPTALSHEERVSITMEKLNTKRMKEGH